MIRLSTERFIPDTEIVCDECGKVLECVPIEIHFGYGHPLDEMIVHFCNNKCLMSYFKKEEKKNKDARFIYGNRKDIKNVK